MSKREFQADDQVRVYGPAALQHDQHDGLRAGRAFLPAVVMRRDEQHGPGQWRVRYTDSGKQDVVAEARLELDPDADQVAA